MICKLVRALALAALLITAGVPALFSHANQASLELQPPANERSLLRVHAQGDQIYSCKVDAERFSWTLKAPKARLYRQDGQPFGEHFSGPSWKANDGSQVTGKAISTAPSPDRNSIPWLLVKVVRRNGEGVLAHVTFIQRINTKGGKAPASGCDAAHVFFASK